MWTIVDAIDLIRILQPKVRECDYHLTLGGGVLNKGTSKKDLDLFFLKLNGFDGDKSKLYDLLLSTFGPLSAIRDAPDYGPDNMFHYREALRVKNFMGKQIDIFIQ